MIKFIKKRPLVTIFTAFGLMFIALLLASTGKPIEAGMCFCMLGMAVTAIVGST